MGYFNAASYGKGPERDQKARKLRIPISVNKSGMESDGEVVAVRSVHHISGMEGIAVAE